jgi:hypothetical protein
MAANGQHGAELHASPQSGRRSHQTPEAFELVLALICMLRSSCPKPLKESLELAGTQPQKFEMRPVWGATHLRVNNLQLAHFALYTNRYKTGCSIAACPS